MTNIRQRLRALEQRADRELGADQEPELLDFDLLSPPELDVFGELMGLGREVFKKRWAGDKRAAAACALRDEMRGDLDRCRALVAKIRVKGEAPTPEILEGMAAAIQGDLQKLEGTAT